MSTMFRKIEWKKQLKLTERELKEIDFARVYAKDFAHGTTGHNGLMLLAKMADYLDYLYTIELLMDTTRDGLNEIGLNDITGQFDDNQLVVEIRLD